MIHAPVRSLAMMLVLLMVAPTAQALLPPLPVDPPVQVGIIQDQIVMQNTTYDGGEYLVTGRISVQGGVTLTLINVTFEFAATSPGIELAPLARLEVYDSVLRSRPGELGARGAFGVDVPYEAGLVMLRSQLAGGQGLRVATNDSIIRHNNFSENQVGLRLVDTNLTIEENRFHNNVWGVNLTGGEPTLTNNNTFYGGTYCVRNWRTHPEITWNVFDGCLVGIYHQQSHSQLSFNWMRDRGDPPGAGIIVEDTMSPTIEGNEISNWGMGILVINARAYIRNNSIHDNVGDGIRIDRSSAGMDIQGNSIRNNGGDGIELYRVHDTPVFGNDIRDNGGHGIHVRSSDDAVIHGNAVTRNGGDGIRVRDSENAALHNNTADGNRAAGIHLTSDSPRGAAADNDVRGSHTKGIEVFADGTVLRNNTVHGAAHTGIFVTASDVRIEQGVVTGSGRIGVHFAGAADAVVHETKSLGNYVQGFLVEESVNVDFDTVESSQNLDGFVFAASYGVDMTCTKVLRNLNDGLRTTGAPPVAHEAWYQDNGGLGVNNLGAATMDARFSYWGHIDGPDAPGHPTAGEQVSANVLYDPFLRSPSACALDQDLVAIIVTGPDAMVANDTTTFEVRGYDRYGNELPLATNYVPYTAPKLVGPTDFAYSEANVTGVKTIEVVPAPLAHIALDGPSELVANTSATYALAGTDAYGNAVALARASTEYAAPTTAGDAIVSYEEQGVVGTKTITVLADALARIEVTGPASMPANTVATFDAAGFDQHGNVVLLENETFEFRAPSRAGLWDVCFTERGITGCTTVELTVGELNSIVLTADASEVSLGRTVQLHAAGYDFAGNLIPLPPISWNASAGSITEDGLLTTPTREGAVTVTASSGTVNGTFVVHATQRLVARVAMERNAYGLADALTGGVRGEVRVTYLDGGVVEQGWVLVFIQRPATAGLPGQVGTVEGEIGPDGRFAFEVPEDWERPGAYVVRAYPETFLHQGRGEAQYRVMPFASGPI